MGKYECLNTINDTLGYSSNLTVSFCDSCSQRGFVLKEWAKSGICLSVAFPWKRKLDFKPRNNAK